MSIDDAIASRLPSLRITSRPVARAPAKPKQDRSNMRVVLLLLVATLLSPAAALAQQHPGKMNPQNTGNRNTGQLGGQRTADDDKMKRPDAAKPTPQDPNAASEPGRTRSQR
jgi:hypothetical protein